METATKDMSHEHEFLLFAGGCIFAMLWLLWLARSDHRQQSLLQTSASLNGQATHLRGLKSPGSRGRQRWNNPFGPENNGNHGGAHSEDLASDAEGSDNTDDLDSRGTRGSLNDSPSSSDAGADSCASPLVADLASGSSNGGRGGDGP